MNEIIIAKGVSKSFGPVNAVRNADFTMKEGEFVALLGASGSGKSTLLGLLSGLESLSAGEVHLDGSVLSRMNEDELALLRREKVGIVFQSFNLIPTLNALENVAFPLFPIRLPAGEKEQKAAKALDRVGLTHRAHHRPGEMSGGEKQRVAIARSLIHNPKIILADEPTGNLDSATGQEIINLLVSLSKENKIALLIATHDQKLAEAANRIISMKDGEIVA
ncbi:MAG TPA: ABC transporter ATP-binding protein [Bacillota bacterium]|nr:ABC transporter ATP-binding protein [Bacillota bacterium]